MRKVICSLVVMLFAVPALAQNWDNQFDLSGPDFSSPRGVEVTSLTCSSHNHKYRECYVDGRIINVRLTRQLSSSDCTPNSTWGFNRTALWVDDGCRGTFRITYRPSNGNGPGHGGPGHGPGNGPAPDSEDIFCSSHENRYASCETSGRIFSAQIMRQYSSSSCRYNIDWGWDRRAIWVDNGCRALFKVRH